MNTFRIYEEFRGPLGEEAARSLATTLGTMFEELKDTVTKEDFRSLREGFSSDVSRIETTMGALAEAQQRTETRLGDLAEAQQRTETRLGTLAEAQQRTETRLGDLAEAQQRTETRLGTLAEAQQRTETRLGDLAEAQQRTETRLGELAEAQQRTETRLGTLAEAQQRTETRLGELAEAQQRTETRLGELAEAQQRTETRLGELAAAQKGTEESLQRLTARTDKVVGDCFEQKFRDRIAAYLGLFLRRCRLADIPTLVDTIEPSVSRSELLDLLRADAIASGTIDGEQVYLVIEASVTADFEDVIRAARRAKILAGAGLKAIPFVACEIAPEVTQRQARDTSVRLWIDGSVAESAA